MASAIWFDRSDMKTAFLLGSEILELAGGRQALAQAAAPDAPPAASRVN
jgi:hypothetical protein